MFFQRCNHLCHEILSCRKRRQKNYGRWFQPSALWSILNMSEKFIPKLIKTLINQSYKMQQDTWNTRLEASYTSLWGLPIVSLSTVVLHSSRQNRILSNKIVFLYYTLLQFWFIFNNFKNLCSKNLHEIQQKIQNFAMSKITIDVLFETCWTPCKKPHVSSWSRTKFTFFVHPIYAKMLSR